MGLKEALPMEKRPKFKPRRQDFTLELLCGNNLFDNIIIESGAVLKEVESVIYLASKSPKIVKQKKLQFKLNKSSKEFGFTLKRMKVPKYMAQTVTENKLLLKRIAYENLKEKQMFETDASCNPDIDLSLLEKKDNEISDTSINSECTERDIISPRTLTSILKKGKSPYEEKSLNFFGKNKNQKTIPQKKFKVSKVTWGPVPSKTKKTPRKAKLKGENKADKENTDLKEALPMEKRPKFKPRRQDFTLELLCGNNLFDNIIIESGAVLKEVESVIYLASKSPKIVKQKKLQFKLNKSSKEFGFTLKRMKVPKYMAQTVTENKLLLKRIA